MTTPVTPTPPSGAAKDLLRWRLAIAVAVAAGLIRLTIAALTPLFPDETYYWEWSRRLDAGYFDHPPVIAWLIRAGTLLAGHTPFGVRLGPVAAGVAGTLLVCAMARHLAGGRAALTASIVFAVMPLSAAGLVLATPDAPLLACIAGAVYALVRAIEAPLRSGRSVAWWCVSGIALGLAVSSKYTAVLLPLGALVALLSRQQLRERLKDPGPYMATLVAVAVFSPVLLWNARHDWISFTFQLRHGLAGAAGSIIARELDLIGGQVGLVSPILFVMCAIATARSLRAPRAPTHVPLAVIAIAIFGFFVYSATRRRVEANWPALAYVPAVALLVAQARTVRWERWLLAGIALSGALTLVTYVNAFVPILPVPARRDPAARASGWDDLAAAVNRVYSVRRPISSYRTLVGADRYQEASELAFHLPDQPETFALNLSGRPNQYDLWPTFPERAQPRDALILVLDDVEGAGQHPTAALLAPHFITVRQGDPVALARNGDVTKRLRIWVLDGWRGTWPEGSLRSRS